MGLFKQSQSDWWFCQTRQICWGKTQRWNANGLLAPRSMDGWSLPLTINVL